MRRHHIHAWARARGFDAQELVDGIHDVVNTAIDAAMNALFEAADHVDDVIADLRSRAESGCATENEGATPGAWNDSD